MRVIDRMKWQKQLQFMFVFIQFGLVNFSNVSNFDVRANGSMVALLQRFVFLQAPF